MTLNELWQVVSAGGVTGLLFLAVYGGLKGWYVSRREYDEVVRQRDAAQKIVDKLTDAALETIDLMRKAERGP